jgi:hypothetical protein
MQSEMNPQGNKMFRILETCSELIAHSVGTFIGYTVDGSPVGAYVGGQSAILFKNVMKDVLSRKLSEREKERVETVGRIALEGMNIKLNNGFTLRGDDFFQGGADSPADELFEGVLLKARNEYQRNKIKHLGFFFSELSCRADTSKDEAIYLLSTVESLSFRQLCLLELIRRKVFWKGHHDIRKNEESYLQWSSDYHCILKEVFDLYNRQLVFQHVEDEKYAHALIDYTYVSFQILNLTDTGNKIAELLRLEEIESSCINEVINCIAESTNQGNNENINHKTDDLVLNQ